MVGLRSSFWTFRTGPTEPEEWDGCSQLSILFMDGKLSVSGQEDTAWAPVHPDMAEEILAEAGEAALLSHVLTT